MYPTLSGTVQVSGDTELIITRNQFQNMATLKEKKEKLTKVKLLDYDTETASILKQNE